MAKNTKLIQVFLSSPGDLLRERDLVEKICSEISHDLGRYQNFTIEVLRWEKHVQPAAGDYAQSIISDGIGNDYDIFIGMWGLRFGSPTKFYGSGTEEEFQIAFDRWRNTSRPEIMLYFFNPSTDPSRLDLEQLAKVRDFKKKIQEQGNVLYFDFDDETKFAVKLRSDIISAISKINKLSDNTEEEEGFAPLQTTEALQTFRNWDSALANDPTLQYEDFLKKATERMANHNQELNKLTDDVKRFVHRMNKATPGLNALNTTSSITAQSIHQFSKSSRDLVSACDTLNENILRRIPEIEGSLSSSLQLIQRAFTVVTSRPEYSALITENDFEEAINSISGLESSYNAIIENAGVVVKLISLVPKVGIYKYAFTKLEVLLSDLIASFERGGKSCSVASDFIRQLKC